MLFNGNLFTPVRLVLDKDTDFGRIEPFDGRNKELKISLRSPKTSVCLVGSKNNPGREKKKRYSEEQ
jgi:hypothetical protein